MVQIAGPFKDNDPRWPNTPCVLTCALDDGDRVELRFEPRTDRRVGEGHSRMSIWRTRDGGRTWQQIPTRLASWWQRFDCDRFWPPDPIDLVSFSVDGEQLEAEISEVAWSYATEGNRRWKLAYRPARRAWTMKRLPSAAADAPGRSAVTSGA